MCPTYTRTYRVLAPYILYICKKWCSALRGYQFQSASLPSTSCPCLSPSSILANPGPGDLIGWNNCQTLLPYPPPPQHTHMPTMTRGRLDLLLLSAYCSMSLPRLSLSQKKKRIGPFVVLATQLCTLHRRTMIPAYISTGSLIALEFPFYRRFWPLNKVHTLPVFANFFMQMSENSTPNPTQAFLLMVDSSPV